MEALSETVRGLKRALSVGQDGGVSDAEACGATAGAWGVAQPRLVRRGSMGASLNDPDALDCVLTRMASYNGCAGSVPDNGLKWEDLAMPGYEEGDYQHVSGELQHLRLPFATRWHTV
jgi:hypothetical protein